MRLAGTHVLLTGATGALGSVLAARLADAGAHLSLVARSEDPLRSLADRVHGLAVPADLTDADAPRAVLEAATEARGPVEVIVHNAGTDAVDELAVTDPDALRRAVLLNLGAPLVLTRLALPSMLARRRGHIVGISSLAGVATFPGLAAYGATKAGLTQGLDGLRSELRGTPVGTTVVQIGPVDSAMMGRISAHPPAQRSFARAHALGVLRTLGADEVAEAVVDAVRRERHHVVLPRRARVLTAVAGAPRALARAVLTGIPTTTAGLAGDSPDAAEVRR